MPRGTAKNLADSTRSAVTPDREWYADTLVRPCPEASQNLERLSVGLNFSKKMLAKILILALINWYGSFERGIGHCRSA